MLVDNALPLTAAAFGLLALVRVIGLSFSDEVKGNAQLHPRCNAALLVAGVFSWLILIDQLSHYPLIYQVSGRYAAAKDIDSGKLLLKTGSHPSYFYDPYEERLASYDIAISRSIGCLGTSRRSGYNRGYNDVMEAEIARRYGNNFLNETRAHVRDKIAKELAEEIAARKTHSVAEPQSPGR